MRDKGLIITIVLSLLLVIVWRYVNVKLEQAHPEWYQPQQPQQAGGQTQTQQPGQPATQSATTQPGMMYAVGGERKPPANIGFDKFDAKAEQSVYPMGVSIDPLGASISSVTLNRLRAAVEKKDPYVFQKPYENLDPASSRSLATQAIVVNDQRIDLHNITWALAESESSHHSATYSVDVMKGDLRQLRVSKIFEVRAANHASKGYELSVVYRFENLTRDPQRVKIYFNGPTVPPPESKNEITEVVAGYDDGRQVLLKHEPASSLDPEKDPYDITAKEKLPLLWSGFTSAYFDTIVLPVTNPPQATIEKAIAKALAKRKDSGEEFVAIHFAMKELAVPAGKTVAQPFEVYFGPRQRAILKSDHYAQFPRAYHETLVLTGGFCGFCTFGVLIDLMVTLLGFFHKFTGDWGLSIICLVIIVRLLLHPITKRAQISMSKMSKLGPEIERLKQKYGDDKEALNREMMAFYREHGVSNFLGCLPMFLQMPIWIALWSSLQSTFELRHASFLWGFTWIKDLSQPDRLIAFSRPFDWWFIHIDAINLLPFLMAVVFWIQQKLTPKPPTMTPEQETQYKIMQWMSLLFPLVLYNGPSGLNLYILTSTTIGIIESKRIRDHIKERDEAEKAGKVIVDAKPTRASKKLERADAPAKPKKRGLSGWLADLQKRAEELRREADRGKKKPGS